MSGRRTDAPLQSSGTTAANAVLINPGKRLKKFLHLLNLHWNNISVNDRIGDQKESQWHTACLTIFVLLMSFSPWFRIYPAKPGRQSPKALQDYCLIIHENWTPYEFSSGTLLYSVINQFFSIEVFETESACKINSEVYHYRSFHLMLTPWRAMFPSQLNLVILALALKRYLDEASYISVDN